MDNPVDNAFEDKKNEMPSVIPKNSFNINEVSDIDLLDLFPPSDGMISQYYGRIGSGKTYAGTMDVLDLLKRGQVCYVNWNIQYKGYDERSELFRIFLSLIFFWMRRFYYFPKDNLKYIAVDEHFHDNFSKITDAHVFLDEGHVVFDSYEMAKLSLEKRKSILHTRHFNRSIHIISQRPTAIHVAMRANVNVFYKCERLWTLFGYVRFRRTEYQDLTNETVDEDPEKIVSVKYYTGTKEVFNAYDTKYLRGDILPSQKVAFKAYDIPYFRRLSMLISGLAGPFYRRIIKEYDKVKVKKYKGRKNSIRSIEKDKQKRSLRELIRKEDFIRSK